ncbi:sensor histidine kinase [Plantactinospora sp. CA-290183]|uniref:sensor histidine kinase n=1 Tax=Plantactinospora sp. CA-290183 TaxID=3240006 RepID=UPI003D8BCCE0
MIENRHRGRTYGRGTLVALLTLLAVHNTAYSTGFRYLTVPTAAAVLCGAALLMRRLPWPVAAVLTTAAAAAWGWPMLLLFMLALFDLAIQRRALIAIGCAGTALFANLFTQPVNSLWEPQQYGSTLFLLLAVVGGLWMGSRRRLTAALHAQVEHLRTERELRQQAARAAERSRIAAEMHDVLAHRLSLIALHTGVLTTKADTLPAQIADRLMLLRTTSTQALTDLRDVLGAIHETDSAYGPPAPVLRDVNELVEQARTTGQHVDLHVNGDPEQAPTAHRLAIYRIVQEALSNTRKHAHGAPVRIRLHYTAPTTTVDVTNTPGTAATDLAESGYGLVGMRERVTALGGHLHVGPAGAGTWRLTATLPHPVGIEQNSSHP